MRTEICGQAEENVTRPPSKVLPAEQKAAGKDSSGGSSGSSGSSGSESMYHEDRSSSYEDEPISSSYEDDKQAR